MSKDTLGRIKVLAAAQPLHALAPTAHRAPFDQMDHYQLGLAVLQIVIDSVGPRGQFGAIRREDLAFEMNSHIRRQLQAIEGAIASATPARIEDHAHWIIDQLLNTADNGRPFRTQLFDPEQKAFETYAYALIVEREGDDGEFYIEPTSHTLNMYFHSMTTSLEDQDVALRALLHHYMQKGEFRKALEAAQSRKRLAGRYKREIDLQVRQMRISLRRISYRDEVGPLLEEAERKAKEMGDSEEQILGFINDNIAGDLTPEQHRTLAEIIEIINHNRTLYTELCTAMIHAQRTFSEELERQGFRFRVARTLPDIEEEVLMPALALPDSGSGDPWSAIVSAFAGPQGVKLFDLTSFLRAALKPKQDRKGYTEAEGSGASEEIPHLADFVSPREVDQCVEFMRLVLTRFGRAQVSALIRAAADQGMRINQQAAVALLCYDAFKNPGGNGFDARRLDQNFDAGFCSGTDLEVRLTAADETAEPQLSALRIAAE